MEVQANGNSEAWKRLVRSVQEGWHNPGDRIEAILETVLFLRKNPSDADVILHPEFEPEDIGL